MRILLISVLLLTACQKPLVLDISMTNDKPTKPAKPECDEECYFFELLNEFGDEFKVKAKVEKKQVVTANKVTAKRKPSRHKH